MRTRSTHLHLAKTGGSSLTRILEDAFPAGSRLPATFVDDFRRVPRDELDRFPLLSGHFGRLPLDTMAKPLGVVTVLRDPTARAWSHYRALRYSHPETSPSWSDAA